MRRKNAITDNRIILNPKLQNENLGTPLTSVSAISLSCIYVRESDVLLRFQRQAPETSVT